MKRVALSAFAASVALALAASPAVCGPVGSAPVQHIGDLKPADLAILRASASHPAFPAAIARAKRAGVDIDVARHFQPVPQIFSNAAVYYLRIAQDDQFAVDSAEKSALKLVDDPQPGRDEWATAKVFLSSHSGLMVMVHAAASYATFAVPREDDGSEPISWPLRELPSCRRVARLLTMESLVLAHEGKFNQAVANERFCFRVGDHAASDITLVGSLVAIAVDNIAFKAMRSILRRSSGDPSIAHAIDVAVSSAWHPRLMSRAIVADDAQMIAQVEFWRNHGADSLNREFGSDGQLVPDPHVFDAMMDAMGAKLINDEISMLRFADRPYPVATKNLNAIAAADIRCKTFDGTFARFVLPVVAQTEDKVTLDSAQAAVTRAACAVFLYKSKHGRYPSTLADAAPTAIDPFDGKLVGYRREANGFVVYSVGPTGQYNGGAFDGTKEHEEVFRYP